MTDEIELDTLSTGKSREDWKGEAFRDAGEATFGGESPIGEGETIEGEVVETFNRPHPTDIPVPKPGKYKLVRISDADPDWESE